MGNCEGQRSPRKANTGKGPAVLPLKSSKWGKMCINTADTSGGFQGDTLTPFARCTKEQDTFGTLRSPESHAKTTIVPSISLLDNTVLKQAFLEVCEGERSRYSASFHTAAWQPIWISLCSSNLFLYDARTQDLMDPFVTIEIRSILHCKAEDTCVFSVETMVDDFMGSLSFHFRTETRLERDLWIKAIDHQIVAQSPISSAKGPHLRGGHHVITPRSVKGASASLGSNSKVQSPVSARNSLRVSSIVCSPRAARFLASISPRGSPSLNRKPPSTKGMRFIDDTEEELHNVSRDDEGDVKANMNELQEMRNVLWCTDISSVIIAKKICSTFANNANHAREIAAKLKVPELSAELDIKLEVLSKGSILTSSTGRLGCFLAFGSEEEAKSAWKSMQFFGSHDGENMKMQLISVLDVDNISSAFHKNTDLVVPSPRSAHHNTPADFHTNSDNAGIHLGISIEKPLSVSVKVKSPRNDGVNEEVDIVQKKEMIELKGEMESKREGSIRQMKELKGAMDARESKREASIRQKGYANAQRSAASKLQNLRTLRMNPKKYFQLNHKVELRALVPNPTAFSYFLISYDPERSSIEMNFVESETVHTLWKGAFTGVAVAPTSKGGNVNVMAGDKFAMQLGQRKWTEFSSLAKTFSLMHQALEKHMIDSDALERHEAKYLNLQEAIHDHSVVGKIRPELSTISKELQNVLPNASHIGDVKAAASVQLDISVHDLQEIAAELSAFSKEQQNVLPSASHIGDEDVQEMFLQIARIRTESRLARETLIRTASDSSYDEKIDCQPTVKSFNENISLPSLPISFPGVFFLLWASGHRSVRGRHSFSCSVLRLSLYKSFVFV